MNEILNNKNTKKIKFIDLFAGIGGFHKALEKISQKQNFDIDCVFVSEIDKEAIRTYSKNFKFNKKIVNIKDIVNEAWKVPDHDFLFAGFPCQTFSNAGKKRGFLDKIKGTLFFDIVEILKKKKPKYILLENVKHLIKHDDGKTWKTIISTLTSIGYLVPKEPLILSPHEFDIPQDRKRVFIPGILKSSIKEKKQTQTKKFKIVFDKKYFLKNIKKNILNSNNTQKILEYIHKKYLEKKVDKKYFLKNRGKNGEYLLKVLFAWEEFLKKVKKPKGRTLPVIWTFELDKKNKLKNLSPWKKKYIEDIRKVYKENKEFIDTWMKKHNVKKWNKREQKFEWQAGAKCDSLKDSFIQLRQSGIRCKKPNKFPTLVAMVQIPIIYDKQNKEWRYLTPRETANLQSFPKDYIIHSDFKDVEKDFNAYKQFGNSVNVVVVQKILNKMLTF